MKKLTALITALFSVIVLTACGGGSSDTASNTPNPKMVDSSKPVSPSGKLIIDSGRGTINNQDTEQLKKSGL